MKHARNIIIIAMLTVAASVSMAGGSCRSGCISGCSARTGCGMPTVLPAMSCYKQLAQYGAWLHHSSYGWVWRPQVAGCSEYWHPQIHGGRWMWQGCSLVWKPSYVWGHLVYSEGTWRFVARIGWVWVPQPEPQPRVNVSYTYSTHGHHGSSHHSSHSHNSHHGQRTYTPSVTVVEQTPPPQMPTRRTQRTTSVVKTQPRTSKTESKPTERNSSSASTSSSRGRRTLTVIRRK